MIKKIRGFLETEVKISIANSIIKRMRNGSTYVISKHPGKSGTLVDCIEWDEKKYNQNDVLVEFLQNYRKEGGLSNQTEAKVLKYIKRLRMEKLLSNKSIPIQEKINLHAEQEINLVDEGSELIMYSDEEKYIYRSNAYKIDDIIDLVIKSKIEKKSPFRLLNEFDIPSGTVHTWYKNSNELRILYSLYNMTFEQINEKFSKYNSEQIRNFNKSIRQDVLQCENISEELRKKYLENIDKYDEYRIKKENRLMSLMENDNNDMLTAIKLITQTKDIWNVYAETNKDKIFEILYNNEEILSMILKKILGE